MKPAVRLPAYRGASLADTTFVPGGVLVDGTDIARLSIAGLDEGQGWVAFRMVYGFTGGVDDPEGATGIPLAWDWRDDEDNRLTVFYSSEFTLWALRRVASASGNQVTQATTLPVAGAPVVVIAAWTATELRLSQAGAAFASQADTNVPILTAATHDLGGVNGFSNIDSTFSGLLWGGGTLRSEDIPILNWVLNSGQPDPARHLPSSARVLGWWDCRGTTYRVAG